MYSTIRVRSLRSRTLNCGTRVCMSRLGVTGLRDRNWCRNFASQRPSHVKNARRTTSCPSLKLPKVLAHQCWRADSGTSRENVGEMDENRKRYSRPHMPMTSVDTPCRTAPYNAGRCVSLCFLLLWHVFERDEFLLTKSIIATLPSSCTHELFALSLVPHTASAISPVFALLWRVLYTVLPRHFV